MKPMWSKNYAIRCLIWPAVLSYFVFAQTCKLWCAKHRAAWQSKCAWDLCSACSECGECVVYMMRSLQNQGGNETPLAKPTNECKTTRLIVGAVATTPSPIGSCESMCLEPSVAWQIKCKQSKCADCQQCSEFSLLNYNDNILLLGK